MSDVNDTNARPEVFEPGRDVLQNPDAPLPINEAKAVRAQERFTPDGKAESSERGTMYHDLENVGESGTQAGQEGVPRTAGTPQSSALTGGSNGGETVDQNPIGKRNG